MTYKIWMREPMFSMYYYDNYRVKVAMSFANKIWWRLMPGTTFKVRWPVGKVLVGPNSREFDGTVNEIPQYVESADPNDHYRPDLEKYIGRQGRDWDWALTDGDVRSNSLTVKIRVGKQKYAAWLMMRWS